MKIIEKLYKIIKIEWLKLPKSTKNLFCALLFLIVNCGLYVLFHSLLLLVFLWIILPITGYFFVYKKINKLSLIPIILFFMLLLITNLTPYRDIKVFQFLIISILLSIFYAISFFVNRPFFLYYDTKKRQNIVTGVYFIIVILSQIFFILIIMNLAKGKMDNYFIFLDTVPPYYNKAILSNLHGKGGVFLLRDNKLERVVYDNTFLIIPLSLKKWCGVLSPNENYIVYWDSYYKDVENIWLIESNGKNKRQLTYNEKILIPTSSCFPLFNLKSNKIAFLRYRIVPKEYRLSKETPELYVIDIDGTGDKQLVKSINPWDWSWAPNGREIYFIKDGNLWIVDVENGTQKQITKDSKKYSFPVVSPDGTKLLIFFSEGLKVKPCIFDIHKLKIIKIFPDLKIVRDMRNYPNYFYIKWSKENNCILFSGKKKGTNNQISILDLRIDRIIYLTSGKDDDMYPVWYNKEEQIMFIRNHEEIWIMNRDGSDAKKIFPK